MGYTWLYILSRRAQEDRLYYVGVTRRLVSRLYRHATMQGSGPTRAHAYGRLEALYKIGSDDMPEKERRKAEDDLTLQLMKVVGHPSRVAGGQWTRHYQEPLLFFEPFECQTVGMPVLCHCNLPAELYETCNGHFCYRCPRSSAQLFRKTVRQEVPESCRFWMRPDMAVKAHEPPRCMVCNCICGPPSSSKVSGLSCAVCTESLRQEDSAAQLT